MFFVRKRRLVKNQSIGIFTVFVRRIVPTKFNHFPYLTKTRVFPIVAVQPIFKESLSALRKKAQTAKNRHPQTQEKTAKKQTQKQVTAVKRRRYCPGVNHEYIRVTRDTLRI